MFFSVFSVQIAMTFPGEGLVYDYALDDAGISLPALDEDEEEELKTREVSNEGDICDI